MFCSEQFTDKLNFFTSPFHFYLCLRRIISLTLSAEGGKLQFWPLNLMILSWKNWLFLETYGDASHTLLGSQNNQKRGFYSIFVVGGDNFRIIKFVFLAFFESKMTKSSILNTKLIVPNDYQQFWIHFEWFLSLFQISDVK